MSMTMPWNNTWQASLAVKPSISRAKCRMFHLHAVFINLAHIHFLAKQSGKKHLQTLLLEERPKVQEIDMHGEKRLEPEN